MKYRDFRIVVEELIAEGILETTESRKKKDDVVTSCSFKCMDSIYLTMRDYDNGGRVPDAEKARKTSLRSMPLMLGSVIEDAITQAEEYVGLNSSEEAYICELEDRLNDENLFVRYPICEIKNKEEARSLIMDLHTKLCKIRQMAIEKRLIKSIETL